MDLFVLAIPYLNSTHFGVKVKWINGLAFTLAFGLGFPVWLAYLTAFGLLLTPVILLIWYFKDKK